MDKRAREEEDGQGDTKRQFLSPLTKQMTPEELEQFQKEAIYRQLNVYRRERDALQEELNVLGHNSKQELETLRARYLEHQRLEERPTSGPPNGAAKESKDTPVPPEEEPAGGQGQGQGQGQAQTQTTSAEVEKLQDDLAAQRGTVVAQAAQIEKLQARVTELEAHIRDLQIAAENPSEESLRKSAIYRACLAKVDALSGDNSRLEQDIRAQLTASAEAKSLAANAEYEARQRSGEQIQALEKKVEVLENEVARLRAARDEKISEINVLKAAEATRLQSLENLKELQKIAQERAEHATKPADTPETTSADNDENINEMPISELQEYAHKLAKKTRILSAELPSLEQAYSKAHAKALTKIQDQAQVEAKINAAQVSKVRADEKFFSAMRAKDALEAEMTRIKSSLTKYAELVSSLRDRETKVNGQLQKREKQISELDQKFLQLQRYQVAEDRRRTDAEGSLQAANHKIESLQEQLKVRDSDVAFAAEKRRGLETQVEKMRKQLEIKRSTSGSGAVQEQLESLRTVALCSLCTNNWKNTAIKACGHVFCSDCANARLSSRMRKCPLCNSQFGHNDLLSIHL